MRRLYPSVLFVLMICLALTFSCGAEDDEREAGTVWSNCSSLCKCGLRQVVDLDMGETAQVTLDNGAVVAVCLCNMETERDPVRGAVRRSVVVVEVDGEPVRLEAGNYTLPVCVGRVRIDCPVTRDVYVNTNEDRWGLRKDARLRLWRRECPLIGEGTFVHPVPDQRWMASRSQAGNEPTDDFMPFMQIIYYHSGVDVGGIEAVDRVTAAAPGLVVLAGGEALDGYEETPARLESGLSGPRIDVVYVLDDRGWYYRYSHLDSVDPGLRIGRRIEAGGPIGMLGRKGTSGGWSHLHFEILCRQPSGEWGTESAYPYLWEAYVREEDPGVLAVARPHRFGLVAEPIELDGSKSRSFAGQIVDYQWIFTDGTTAHGARAIRTYPGPGFYTEVLKVTDGEGNVGFDFAVVQIVHADDPRPRYSYLHAAHSPSKDVRPGVDVLFTARVFGIGGGAEVWDFGDQTPPEVTRSDNSPFGGYASVLHRYDRPGDYLVRVDRTNRFGEPSIARLWVRVTENP